MEPTSPSLEEELREEGERTELERIKSAVREELADGDHRKDRRRDDPRFLDTVAYSGKAELTDLEKAGHARRLMDLDQGAGETASFRGSARTPDYSELQAHHCLERDNGNCSPAPKARSPLRCCCWKPRQTCHSHRSLKSRWPRLGGFEQSR